MSVAKVEQQFRDLLVLNDCASSTLDSEDTGDLEDDVLRMLVIVQEISLTAYPLV